MVTESPKYPFLSCSFPSRRKPLLDKKISSDKLKGVRYGWHSIVVPTFFLIAAFFFSINLGIARAQETVATTTTATTTVNTTEVIAASSTIPDEALDHLLFRVGDDLKDKVQALGAEKFTSLPVPVFGVSPDEIQDTWGEARAHGRVHEGTDIMAPRGELILSPTKAVVSNIGHDSIGGNFVITIAPGGEQFYYAHLARYPFL